MEEKNVTTGNTGSRTDGDGHLVRTEIEDIPTEYANTLSTVTTFPVSTQPTHPTTLRSPGAVSPRPFHRFVLCQGDPWPLSGLQVLNLQPATHASVGQDVEIMNAVMAVRVGTCVQNSSVFLQHLPSGVAAGDCVLDLVITGNDQNFVGSSLNTPMFVGSSLNTPMFGGSSLNTPMFGGSNLNTLMFGGSSLNTPMFGGSSLNNTPMFVGCSLNNTPIRNYADSATDNVEEDACDSQALVLTQDGSVARQERWQGSRRTVHTFTKLLVGRPEILTSLLAAFANSNGSDGRVGPWEVWTQEDIMNTGLVVAIIRGNQMTCFQDTAITSFQHLADALSSHGRLSVFSATVWCLSSDVKCLTLCPSSSTLPQRPSYFSIFPKGSQSRYPPLSWSFPNNSHSPFQSLSRSVPSVTHPSFESLSQNVSGLSRLSVLSLDRSRLPDFPIPALCVTSSPLCNRRFLSHLVQLSSLPLWDQYISRALELVDLEDPQDMLVCLCTFIGFTPASADLSWLVSNVLAVPEYATGINRQNRFGFTSLVLVILRPNIVSLLLAAGADPEIPDNGGKTFLGYLLCMCPQYISADHLLRLVLTCIRGGVIFYRWNPCRWSVRAQSPLEVLHLKVITDKRLLTILKEVGLFHPSHVCPPFSQAVQARLGAENLHLVRNVFCRPLSLQSTVRLWFLREYRGSLDDVISGLTRTWHAEEEGCEVAFISCTVAHHLRFNIL